MIYVAFSWKPSHYSRPGQFITVSFNCRADRNQSICLGHMCLFNRRYQQRRWLLLVRWLKPDQWHLNRHFTIIKCANIDQKWHHYKISVLFLISLILTNKTGKSHIDTNAIFSSTHRFPLIESWNDEYGGFVSCLWVTYSSSSPTVYVYMLTRKIILVWYNSVILFSLENSLH